MRDVGAAPGHAVGDAEVVLTPALVAHIVPETQLDHFRRVHEVKSSLGISAPHGSALAKCSQRGTFILAKSWRAHQLEHDRLREGYNPDYLPSLMVPLGL